MNIHVCSGLTPGGRWLQDTEAPFLAYKGSPKLQTSGVLGGVEVGYNYRVRRLVFGPEIDFAAAFLSDRRRTGPFPPYVETGDVYRFGSALVGFQGNDIVFPSYDGNGMYLSAGNIAENPNVGLLFIDVETPRRLRVQGVARLSRNFDRSAHVGAELLIIVRTTEIFVNCPRYIHRYRKVDASRHVPQTGVCQPLASWKRIDVLRPSLSEIDRRRVDELGTLTLEEYDALVAAKEA